jgi:hypothetical protein
MMDPEVEQQESRWEIARGALLALAELAIVLAGTILFLLKPLIIRVIGAVFVFLLLVTIFGSPSDPLYYVAAAIVSLVVILYLVRKTMQG